MQAKNASKRRWAHKIQEELGDKVPTELQDTIKKSGDSIVEGLGGLLGGKKKQDNPE